MDIGTAISRASLIFPDYIFFKMALASKQSIVPNTKQLWWKVTKYKYKVQILGTFMLLLHVKYYSKYFLLLLYYILYLVSLLYNQ